MSLKNRHLLGLEGYPAEDIQTIIDTAFTFRLPFGCLIGADLGPFSFLIYPPPTEAVVAVGLS